MLHLAGRAARPGASRRWPRSRSFPLRHAVLHLSRPGNQTRVILLAVGLGAFFIVGVRSLQASLLEEFSLQLGEDAPDMFLMDVQRDQADGMRALLADPAARRGPVPAIPVLRARVTGVSGRETSIESFEDVRARGSLARVHRHLSRSARGERTHRRRARSGRGRRRRHSRGLDRGRHHRAVPESALATSMRFDILGRVDQRAGDEHPRGRLARRAQRRLHVRLPPRGRSTTRRRRSSRRWRGPADQSTRARLQHDLVAQFPNVSAIDFREILDTIRDVMSKVTLAINVVGGLVLFSGGLILIGAVA